MSDTLDRVMNQADTAAASFQNNAAANVPAVQQQAAPPAVRPSLDGMADSSGIAVEEYLTMKDTGFRLGDPKNKLFTEFKATIDMTKVAPISSVRATRGGNTTFIKSYDGVMTSTGQSFELATNNLRATHDKVDGPYQTVEIPLVLLEAVPGAKAGDVIGITPPLTGAKFFTEFYKTLRERSLHQANVEVIVRHKYMTNKSGNEWGVATFELVGPAAE
jgi:hypothetical protein